MLTDPTIPKNRNMRHLSFIYLLICLTSCNAQQRSNPASQTIDTLKLFDPTGENDGIAQIVETKNAIILQKDFYDIMLGDKEYPIIEKEKVAKFLRDSSSIINKKKFYIIIDSSKSFKDIVDIIDIVKNSKIEKYQVFNLQTRVKIPDAVQVQTPKSVDNKIDPKHSTYLKIVLNENGYKVSLLSDSLVTADIKKIDAFLLKNLDNVNKNKVFVMGNSKEKYAKFKGLIAVLKKYEIFRFSIVTEPNY
jgi:biopolymer transport protein ExbD